MNKKKAVLKYKPNSFVPVYMLIKYIPTYIITIPISLCGTNEIEYLTNSKYFSKLNPSLKSFDMTGLKIINTINSPETKPII